MGGNGDRGPMWVPWMVEYVGNSSRFTHGTTMVLMVKLEFAFGSSSKRRMMPNRQFDLNLHV